MNADLALPDYREQSPEVAARFERLRQRPVALEVSNLTKRFETPRGVITALDDVSFSVHKRELLSVIGPSGCGKSTLVRILAGLETPTAGELRVYGEPVSGPGPDRGMVFQGYTLFPWRTVKENVMFGPRMAGTPAFTAESEAREWIELVGLSKFENAYPHQLSGGMKQRVAIARALANQPRVLFMDEPFGALDAQTRCQMQSYLLEIWKNVDITIVFITHDLDEAVFLSDRILVLDANPGRVREVVEVPVSRPRTPEQLFHPSFMGVRQHVDHLIHPPGQEQKEAPVLRLAVWTLTLSDSFHVTANNHAPTLHTYSTNRMNIEQIIAMRDDLKKQGVKYCIGAFVDIHGVPKAKFVPIDHLEDFAAGTERYTGYALDGFGQLRTTMKSPRCPTSPAAASCHGTRKSPGFRRTTPSRASPTK